MKILVISDSHGNINNLKHVMGFGKKINVGAVIHCGDWNNLKSVKLVESYNIPLYAVVGNADIDDDIKNYFPKISEFILENKKFAVTHSILHSKLSIINYTAVFTGHIHKQSKTGNVINPGALEYDINFAIYDTETNNVEFFNDYI